METGTISTLANVMKSEEDSLCLAGKGEGEESLELEGLEEDSVKVKGGALRSQDGEEGCDLGSGVKDFDMTGDLRVAMQGDEASFGDSVKVEDERAGDSWRWMTGWVQAETWGSAANSSVCRGVWNEDGAGDMARGCVILELGDEGPR